jgi:sugar/nucleoside kinase (ribokinase family)
MSDDVLVVGSLAFDSIRTMHGEVEEEPGGAATYFSLAASQFAPVNLVGVVGGDFDRELLNTLEDNGVDLDGLTVEEDAETFRWKGYYEEDLEAQTEDTQLNVFADFDPDIPSAYRDSSHVFLANIDPEIRLSVLEQVNSPEVVACDTMNFWIENKMDALERVLERVDFFFLNDSEATLLTGEANLSVAGEKLREMGPSVAIIKKGEHGVFMSGRGWEFVLPGFPVALVKDPTGAGDSFGGGFMGYLAQLNETDFTSLKDALVHGNITASFTVEEFGIDGLLEMRDWDLDERYRRFVRMTHFDGNA